MLQLTKHHGLGNDFLVALEDHNPAIVPDPDVVRALCDRHTGIGADGVLFGLAPADPVNDTCMVLLNADGSEAEISGNGIRCLGQALIRARGASEGLVSVETVTGTRTIRTVRGDPESELWLQVDMGVPGPGPEPGPRTRARRARNLATVDVGNPHLVLEVPEPDAVDLAVVGAELEADYEGGINVHLVAIEGPGAIRMRVWERGVGLTRACGSGAVAAVVAASQWGRTGDRVEVRMPGGSAIVERHGPSMLLTGPSVFVAEVRVPQRVATEAPR